MSYISICLIVVTLASVALSYNDSCQKDKKFDVALMSIQWAPGICAKSSVCVKYGNDFTIHGMWPNFNDNSYPSNCCFQQFLNKGTLDPLMNRMKKHWPSLYDNDSWKFWIHEWKKHGTCAKFSSLIGQFNYFSKTLDLYEKTNLPGWLKAASITPGNAGIPLQVFREAIRKGFTKRPQIVCSRNPDGLPNITEVRLCYNPVTLAPIDCPVETDKRCKSKTGKVVLLSA